jgi:hypothetical protein
VLELSAKLRQSALEQEGHDLRESLSFLFFVGERRESAAASNPSGTT